MKFLQVTINRFHLTFLLYPMKCFRNFYFIGLFTFIFFLSCSTDPEPPNVEPIPGYQQDIPWPSLANVPFPKLYATPQSISRFNENLPESLKLNWVIDTLNISSGIVMGRDSTIYVPSPPYLYAIDLNGNTKWKLRLGLYSNITPIITNSDEIIVYFESPSKITSVSPIGEINWELQFNFNISSQLNIGKNGEIYFVAKKTFYTVNNRQISSSLYDERFGNLFSLSPDGNYAYIVGRTSSILVINLLENIIEREIGKGINGCPPLVDSDGNIYFSSIIENYNNDQPALFSLTPNLEVRWFLPHGESSSGNRFGYLTGAMDKLGNYYFGYDTVYSVSHDGNLNWKYIPDNPIGSDFICDANGNILLIKTYGNSFGLLVLNPDGIPIYESFENSLTGSSTGYHGVFLDNKLILPTQDKYLYLLGEK